jgi:hypothetical protein
MITKAKDTTKVLHLLDKLVFDTSNNLTETEAAERWTIYTDLVDQFKSLNKTNHIHEIHYRILIGENVNSVLIDIIDRDNELYFILYPYIYILEEFYDFDEIKMFV